MFNPFTLLIWVYFFHTSSSSLLWWVDVSDFVVVLCELYLLDTFLNLAISFSQLLGIVWLISVYILSSVPRKQFFVFTGCFHQHVASWLPWNFSSNWSYFRNSDWLWASWLGFRGLIPGGTWEFFSSPCPDHLWGAFPWLKWSGCETTHFLIVPSSRMCDAIPPSPIMSSWHDA
jgi:hypothetical protein